MTPRKQSRGGQTAPKTQKTNPSDLKKSQKPSGKITKSPLGSPSIVMQRSLILKHIEVKSLQLVLGETVDLAQFAA